MAFGAGKTKIAFWKYACYCECMDQDMSEIEAGQTHRENTHELINPDLQVGNVSIWMSEDANGFEISDNPQNALSRKQEPLTLNSDERQLLAGKMSAEGNWTGANKAKALLDELRQENTDPNVFYAKLGDFRTEQDVYVTKGHKPKVGIRNIQRKDNTLYFDTKPVSFPVYSNFAKEEQSTEVIDLAENAATCMSIITADNKVLVQHRNPVNELYGDMPGASIAGMFDGTFDRESHTKGKLETITKNSVLKNIRNEAREEMGMEEGDYQPVLVGLCEEIKPVVHHEFLFTAQTHLTSDEIKQKALNTNRARKKELKPEDIEEKFEFIDATPEALYTLLADFKCPLPPTHTAVFAATAYELALKRDGKTSADEFRNRLQEGIKANYNAMDQMVKEYYEQDPQRLNDIPARLMSKVNRAVDSFRSKNPEITDIQLKEFKENEIAQLPKRDPKAYNPSYLPKEQGLPEFDQEMERTGLSV